MAKIPVTDGGLTEAQAIEAGTLLRQGWDILRSLQFNKKASILRYTEVTSAVPQLGIPAEVELVDDLNDLDVYVSRLSTREVEASNGKLELTDKLFVFYQEVRSTDRILYGGREYEVIQIKHYDADTGQSQVVGRMI